ncbi:MAG: hypothetical protein K9K40_10755 [Desulfotignum sp.]|nr:hypothetical protein [Desulfotignum sp.]MCF8126488.1 hypothetical protein [Desulfotignum sp.]
MFYHFKSRRTAYGLILFFIALSGFAQMPIFKRYYIADIPGLGWLAQFYVTHVIHYGMAALLLGLGMYVAVDYFLAHRSSSSKSGTINRASRLTLSAQVKIISLAGLILTGCFMVIKNLSEVYYPHGVIIGLDLLHLLFGMVLLGATAYTWIRRRTWIR